MSESKTASGYEAAHVDQFLCVPGARVTVTGWEEPISIEVLLALVGRIAATQPKVKVRYQIEIG